MGMRVVFYDVAARMPMGNARAVRTLNELLEGSDAVTLHVPATEATRMMIGGEQLAKMKRGACLLNNARGNVVDLDALAASLRSGHLAGAAVDVFPEEPAGRSTGFTCPLSGLANVILTPHVGGSTAEAQEAIALDAVEKLIKFVNVGTTTGAVNVPEVELPEQPDAQPRPHRILHFHRNVPGVLSNMHAAIAELGANISAEYLRTKDETGYVVLDTDPVNTDRLLERVRAIPETIRVRMLW
jgi:D-3-phosphoglycerate dehydrogenase